MTDFNAALSAFIDSINNDGEEYFAKNYGNIEWDEVSAVGGNKYVKLAHANRVYCFVAAVDVPNKNVKAGDILMAASYKAPALNRKRPAAGNIFDLASYESKDKAYGSWLYV